MARLVWWRAQTHASARRRHSGGRRTKSRWQVFLALTIFTIAAFALPWGWGKVDRALHGVAPGVTLRDERMAALLPDELATRLAQLAEEWRVEAEDARYDVASGVVVPEVIGRRLDVAVTRQALLDAPRGTRVEPSWLYKQPRVRAAYFEPLFHGPPDVLQVAFAVNVDWGEEVLPSMLHTLDELDVQVTFFPTGRWAERFPELTSRLSKAGHEVGTHGMRHDNPVKLDRAAFRRHVEQGAAIVERFTGQMPQLYAPPSGEWDEAHVRYAAAMGYRTVLWTVDTIDWMGPSAAEITARVLKRVQGGSIVLMHPKPATAQALPGMIRALRERGYEIVPVSRLVDRS